MFLFESIKIKEKKGGGERGENVEKAKLEKNPHPVFLTKPHNEEILFKTKELQKLT